MLGESQQVYAADSKNHAMVPSVRLKSFSHTPPGTMPAVFYVKSAPLERSSDGGGHFNLLEEQSKRKLNFNYFL